MQRSFRVSLAAGTRFYTISKLDVDDIRVNPLLSSVRLSRKADYALRIILCIAGRPRGLTINTRTISKNCGVPVHYVPKVVKVLHLAGYVRTIRGRAGGVILAVDPAKLSLLDLLKSVSGGSVSQLCTHGPGCALPCGRLRPIQEEIRGLLSSVTISQLVPEIQD